MPKDALHAGEFDLAQGTVGNFKLLDHRGTSHELHRYGDRDAVVVSAHSIPCGLIGGNTRLDRLAALYEGANLVFLLIDPNPPPDRLVLSASVAASSLPVLLDWTGEISASLGLHDAGATVVIRPADWRIVFRGHDDRVTEAVRAVVNDDPLPLIKMPASSGSTPCPIDIPPHADITYADHIAPLLIQKCAYCHRIGGVAPWAMTSHFIVRGFAPMIREVLRTKRMPPWNADPTYGNFANDRSLSVPDARDLLRWIDSGARKRPDEKDPLRLLPRDEPTWTLGTPDLVLDVPEFQIPASGIVSYRYPSIQNPLDQPRWIKAVEFIPGDRAALHHALIGIGPATASTTLIASSGSLAGYAPGDSIRVMPDDGGIPLPARARLAFQLHYTPYGKASIDRSRLGLYFHDRPPKHRIRVGQVLDTTIRIPAHSNTYSATAGRLFQRPVVLFSLLPHAHYRGKAAEFKAIYSDGTEEMLLSVPDFDFNWQTNYVLDPPKVLPAGTRLMYRAWWDNTAANPGNPDPSKEVTWGYQSSDEMMIGWFMYRYM